MMKYCAIAVLLLLTACASSAPPAPDAGADGRDDPQAAGQPGAADLATGTLGLDRQFVCLGARASTSMRPATAGPGCRRYWEKTDSGWVWHPAHWL